MLEIIIGSAIILTVLGFWMFQLGTNRPSMQIKEELKTRFLLDHFASWYADQVWTCVKTEKNGHGFMGLPANNILVESESGDRILLCGYSHVAVGDKLRSRPATDEEMSNGVWVSPADRYLVFEKVPVPKPST